MSGFLTGASAGVMCAIVCDGAGSAAHGGEGASVICRTMVDGLRRHFAVSCDLPSDDDIWSWVDLARDKLSIAAEKRGKARRAFAATLVAIVIAGDETLTVHVGDGAIVCRAGDDSWTTLSAPENGEYASMTYFVTDDPAPQLRISRVAGSYTGFAVFSDGIENLALDQRTNDPHVPFFRTMLSPLDSVKNDGRDVKLSAALAGFLRSQRVCDKTDDDKTLILISSR